MTKIKELQKQYQDKLKKYNNPNNSMDKKRKLLNGLIDILHIIQNEVPEKREQIEDLIFNLFDDFFSFYENEDYYEHKHTLEIDYNHIDKKWEMKEFKTKRNKYLLDEFERFLKEKFVDEIKEDSGELIVEIIDKKNYIRNIYFHFRFVKKNSFEGDVWRTNYFTINNLYKDFDKIHLGIDSIYNKSKDDKWNLPRIPEKKSKWQLNNKQ